MSELHRLPSSAPGPPPSQHLPGRNVLPMGTVRNFCWTLTLSGSSSPAPPLLFPIVWVPRSPHLLVALPQVPKMHMVMMTLACMSMALSLKSKACKEGAEQSDAITRGLSARCVHVVLLFRHVQLCPQPHCCRKWCKGAEIVVNGGPTLAWPPVPGIFWVKGGRIPQASACACCGSKGISHFSQFTWLIHSVVLLLAPLSLPGSTEDS